MFHAPRPAVLALGVLASFQLACLGLGKDETDAGDGGGDPVVSPDSDGDGLTDAEEQQLGTDPQLVDTDGDSWGDGDEVVGNTDPLKKKDHPYTGGWAIDDCRWDIQGTGDDLGDIATNFKLEDQHGDTLSLHDFCGREVLLVGAAFW